jgi:hypothetical protein
MAEIFFKLITIRPQLKTFDEVPASLQPAVQESLVNAGYDKSGERIQ